MPSSTVNEDFINVSLPCFGWMAAVLRIAMGIVFFLAGFSKLTTEGGWSAAGYLEYATGPFAEWFQSMAGSALVDQLNMWGLLLIGLALILGAFVRTASAFGIVLMLLYYFSGFESNTAHGLIDEHIIYSIVFTMFIAGGFGHVIGLDSILERAWGKTRSWTRWLLG